VVSRRYTLARRAGPWICDVRFVIGDARRAQGVPAGLHPPLVSCRAGGQRPRRALTFRGWVTWPLAIPPAVAGRPSRPGRARSSRGQYRHSSRGRVLGNPGGVGRERDRSPLVVFAETRRMATGLGARRPPTEAGSIAQPPHPHPTEAHAEAWTDAPRHFGHRRAPSADATLRSAYSAEVASATKAGSGPSLRSTSRRGQMADERRALVCG
jgi:hypothetical protein